MYSSEDSTFVVCPYNSEHVLKSFRLPNHILKCRRKYPQIKLDYCKFNRNHLVRKEDMLKHLEACPNKTKIETSVYGNSTDICQNTYRMDFEETCYETEESSCTLEPIRMRREKNSDSPNDTQDLSSLEIKSRDVKNCDLEALEDEFLQDEPIKYLHPITRR